MGKRRYNSKQIAKQPLLKKNMAKFCAHVDVKYNTEKRPDMEEILANGHRGYISLSEDNLAKTFDIKFEILRSKYFAMKAKDDKQKIEDRWYRMDKEFEDATLWYEEGVDIANQVFEEKFLK